MQDLYNLVEEGQVVVFYNWWSGFENIEIAHCFTRLTSKEVSELKAGDLVWVDEEPYNAHGRVWGRSLLKVSSVQKGYIHFNHSLYSMDSNSLYKVNPEDEKKLARLIIDNKRHVFNTLLLPDNMTKEDIQKLPPMDEVRKVFDEDRKNRKG